MKIFQSVFRGTVPIISAKDLPESQATIASNCRLHGGDIEPIRNLEEVAVLAKLGPINSIYRFNPNVGDPDSGYWFHWPEDVDVVQGAIRDDNSLRTIYTGEDYPRITDTALAQASPNYPDHGHRLGVPQPTTSFTATVAGVPNIDANAVRDTIARQYVMTYVYKWGPLEMEGPPCDPTAIENWLPGQTMSLTGLPNWGGANYQITHRRIYRTDVTGTYYRFVKEVTYATTSTTDNVEEEALGEELVSQFNFPPPDDMHSVGQLENGITYGASGNSLLASEPYLPHAYNPLNKQVTQYNIVGTGNFGNAIVAITKKNPYVIRGSSPNVFDVKEIKNNQGCVSKRGIVSGAWGCIYPSEHGLILLNSSGHKNIIADYMDRDDWAAINPSTLFSVVYDNAYMGFYLDGATRKAFMLDPSKPEQGIIYLNAAGVTAAFADPLSKKLYLCIANKIYKWDEVGLGTSYIWQSKEIVSNRPIKPSAGQIYAKSYANLSLTLIVDGASQTPITITNNKPFRFNIPMGKVFQYKLIGTDVVEQLTIATSMSELAE